MRIDSESRLGSIVAYETYLVIELKLHGGDIRRIESLQSEGMDMSSIVMKYLLDRICHGVFTASPEAFSNARIYYKKPLKKLRVILPRAASDAKTVHRQVMFGPKDFQIRGEGTLSYGRLQEPEPAPLDDEWEEWEEV
jgi:hypothetical protein